MAEEFMSALREALVNDDALRAGFGAADSVDDVVRIAGEAGYPISADDLVIVGSGELSDRELADVTGGAEHVWSANPVYVSGFGAFC